MKYFAVYHKATGEILRSGECPDNMVEIQLAKLDPVEYGVCVTATPTDDITEKVENAVAVKRPKAEQDARRAANEAAQRLPLGFKSREVRIVEVLKHLEKQGVDLGDAGKAL